MSSTQTKVRVGLFAVAAATLVIIVIVTFTSLHLFRHRDRFDIVFTGSVYGLEKGSLVYFDGIKHGSVDEIDIEPNDLSKVRVSILVDPETPIRADTSAEMTMAGITGLKVVDLRGGSPTAPRLVEGATLVAKPGMIDKLQSTAEHFADQADQLMTKLGTIVDRSSKVAINVDDATASLRDMVTENREALHHAIASVDATVTSVGGDVHALVASANTAMTSANEVMTGAHTFVDGANGLAGDIGRIIHANEAQLTGALADIRQASRTFKDLARDLREKPSRVLFSGTASDRKLP